MRLPRGTKLRSGFRYENTDENIRNRHHPPTRVVYGSNVADEMADVYLQVTTAHPDERAAFMEDLDQYNMRSQIVGFNKTLQKYPQDPWSREDLAACEVALGKPAEAIRLLEDRLKLSAADTNHALVSLGLARVAVGDFDRAEKVERQVLAKDPAYSDAWLGLGKALTAESRIQDAEQAFRKASELAPALTDAHLELADNFVKQGKLAEAAAACSEAIKSSPDMADAYVKLAGILARQKKYDECLRYLVTAQQLAPYTHPPKVLLAVFYYQNGDAEQSKKLLREARIESPQHPVPELFLGQFALREKDFANAREYLESAASRPIPANWPESHKKRFMVLLETERFKLAQQVQDIDLARRAVTEWIKYDPENRQVQEFYKSLHSTDNR